MAKLTVARLFEVSQVATTKAYQELSPFVDYVNSLADNLVRILINGVGMDNMDGERLKQDFKHSIPSAFITSKPLKRPVSVKVCQQSPITPAITSFVWEINQKNEIVAIITLADSAYQSAITVTLEVNYS